MFLWFRRGEKGRLISDINGKIALIYSGNIDEPCLVEAEIVEENQKYFLVHILGEAAALEMPTFNENRSIRLKTASRLFGKYDIRENMLKKGEEMVVFYWRGIPQRVFDSRLLAEIRLNQPRNRRPRWGK